ncbi:MULTISPECIES: ABC transporter ATP-binding protein [Thalassospira]|jgi:subfamily B ATP-binding cassette protein MsbA|uniref:ABC transporter permease n=2 Tax=Thalassospira TaxID=168934 RepID=A0ABR5XVZ4_9PROT|nr:MULTISPECIES: ABC transporter transmembrane domain-containing protein [Thalassospira]MBR9818261.1 ATP-binding cassette domain-containing protein [Rhodospirillales bacterium]KZC96940.1 ABC transporter permease [Thalassospira xiamenensis]KZD09347.1 ABC transporter permease [Thalassospira xiamenensis]MAB34887.1 ABC transporter permease [Thalassospira sp.]MAL29385.1 ABC transporter permease [Thalassospira sp.]|tara:strand:- start:2529 stop:4259 length:1731 start_codon:yes stop_codon:yes gene_type:complete
MIRRIVQDAVAPYFGKIVLALICMALMAAATGGYAYLMDPVINEVFVKKNPAMLVPVGVAVLAAFALKGFANYGQSVLMSYVGGRILADIQNKLYEHVIRLDIGFFHNTNTGKLITRFTSDITAMRAAVSVSLTGFGKDFLTAIVLIGVMFYQDWQLAIIAFTVFPAAILPIARLGKRMRKVSANTQQQIGEFATLLEQTFQGVRHVKAYGMEPYECSRMEKLVETVFDLSFKAQKVSARSSPIMETLGGAAITTIIIYGGSRVIDGASDPGSFFSFITALLLAYEPVKRLANININLQAGLAASQRVFTVLDIEPEIRDADDAKTLQVKGGAIQFKDVSFSYNNETTALRNISLDIEAGQTIALVGPSGAGKSTILNLIPRFYDINAGAITIDGQDIRDVTLESLRSATALVSQEITLFDDTVRSNIAYGRFGASDAEIEEAARHAAAHDFILQLENGYDTIVGEHGVKLSGGQRQRIAIARAMLKNAPILLLDEATSALDTESERHIQGALTELMKGRTTLVIAHRLSTIVDADKICVIQNGHVTEQGRHEELLALGGAYANLYNLQFSEESDN